MLFDLGHDKEFFWAILLWWGFCQASSEEVSGIGHFRYEHFGDKSINLRIADCERRFGAWENSNPWSWRATLADHSEFGVQGKVCHGLVGEFDCKSRSMIMGASLLTVMRWDFDPHASAVTRDPRLKEPVSWVSISFKPRNTAMCCPSHCFHFSLRE